jgi:hypothetical protein
MRRATWQSTRSTRGRTPASTSCRISRCGRTRARRRTFTIDFHILDSTAAVADAIATIDALRRGRPTTLNPETIKP